MSLKRSRKEMSNSMSKPQRRVSKNVQFSDAVAWIPTLQDQEAAVSLWYTPLELAAPLEDAKMSFSSYSDYAILLRNSYLTPHISVQEYLNAFAAGEDCQALRGLEGHIDGSLKEERSLTRKQHVAALLKAQETTRNWTDLCECSRQSSAPSKLFAMRLGRADARWNEESPQAAREIVEECKHKEEQESLRLSIRKRLSSNDSISTASTMEYGYSLSTLSTQCMSMKSSIAALPTTIVCSKMAQTSKVA